MLYTLFIQRVHLMIYDKIYNGSFLYLALHDPENAILLFRASVHECDRLLRNNYNNYKNDSNNNSSSSDNDNETTTKSQSTDSMPLAELYFIYGSSLAELARADEDGQESELCFEEAIDRLETGIEHIDENTNLDLKCNLYIEQGKTLLDQVWPCYLYLF